MKLIDIKCPHCGASLKIETGSKECTCQYCGAKFLIDDEVLHVQYDNAEESGYLFEKGRQRAKKEAQRGNFQPQNDKQEQLHKKHILLWVLGWLCIFPVPLTILLLKNKKLKPAVKYGLIAVGWIVYLMIAFSGNNNSSNQQDSSVDATAETSEISTTGSSEMSETDGSTTGVDEIITDFVEKFNKSSDVPLEYVEDFVPSDQNSGHYRTEFRLSAYENAVGKSYKYGDQTVDLIGRKNLSDGVLRIYMDGATLDQCISMVKIASPIMDPDITSTELQKTVDYLTENKEANGYYYADLGLLLLGNDKQGYDLMMKPGND